MWLAFPKQLITISVARTSPLVLIPPSIPPPKPWTSCRPPPRIIIWATVLEVMGRDAGWIALHAGVAGGADAILIPEIPFDIEIVCQKIRQLKLSGRNHSLIIVAEGAAPLGGQQYRIKSEGQQGTRLGGVGHIVGDLLAEGVGSEVRVTVLGHVQRGGQPTTYDRWLATRFGSAAVHLVAQEKWGYMAALQGMRMSAVKMEDAIKMKFVDVNGETVQMARDLGVVFG